MFYFTFDFHRNKVRKIDIMIYYTNEEQGVVNHEKYKNVLL